MERCSASVGQKLAVWTEHMLSYNGSMHYLLYYGLHLHLRLYCFRMKETITRSPGGSPITPESFNVYPQPKHVTCCPNKPYTKKTLILHLLFCLFKMYRKYMPKAC